MTQVYPTKFGNKWTPMIRRALVVVDDCFVASLMKYRVAQKVSHYRESLLSRIKNRQPG